MRRCPRCQQDKPDEEWGPRQTACKPCRAEWRRNIYRFKRLAGLSDAQINAGIRGPCQNRGCGRVGPIHFDHDHRTGHLRGGLCFHCNVALGHAQDSIEVLEGLISYLKNAERLPLV